MKVIIILLNKWPRNRFDFVPPVFNGVEIRRIGGKKQKKTLPNHYCPVINQTNRVA